MSAIRMVRAAPVVMRWGRTGSRCMGRVTFEVEHSGRVLRLPTAAPSGHALSVAELRGQARRYLDALRRGLVEA